MRKMLPHFTEKVRGRGGGGSGSGTRSSFARSFALAAVKSARKEQAVPPQPKENKRRRAVDNRTRVERGAPPHWRAFSFPDSHILDTRVSTGSPQMNATR